MHSTTAGSKCVTDSQISGMLNHTAQFYQKINKQTKKEKGKRLLKNNYKLWHISASMPLIKISRYCYFCINRVKKRGESMLIADQWFNYYTGPWVQPNCYVTICSKNVENAISEDSLHCLFFCLSGNDVQYIELNLKCTNKLELNSFYTPKII